MTHGGARIGGNEQALYAEMQPLARHRPFVDHLFILRDCGRLTGLGRNLFASPFSEIVLIGRHPDNLGTDCDGAAVWKALHLPPRFGRTPRRRSFHGWMLGLRCQPLDRDMDVAVLAELSELFTAQTVDQDSLDPIILALDVWIDHLGTRVKAATPRPLRGGGPADSSENSSSRSGLNRNGNENVAALAASLGVAPRTLQRHFRGRIGLTPKRYTAVQRFNGALRQVALGHDNLAHVASDAGYSDQAHLTTELGRHTGLSPGRFRAQARQQIVQDAVRFFKDPDLQNRVRLVAVDSNMAGNEARDDQLHPKGCKLRGPGPSELRTPDRNGDARR